MIGLAIEMTRSSWTMDQITQLYTACFQPERKVRSLLDSSPQCPQVPGIPMVPGLGLYLDELFFEKYNLKLKYDEEKKEKSLLKKQRVAGESSSANAAEEEKEDTSISVSATPIFFSSSSFVHGTDWLDVQPVSKLEWSADPAVAKRCQDFKNDILYPHIADQVRRLLPSHFPHLLTGKSFFGVCLLLRLPPH
jgi:hypothetical protein